MFFLGAMLCNRCKRKISILGTGVGGGEGFFFLFLVLVLWGGKEGADGVFSWCFGV